MLCSTSACRVFSQLGILYIVAAVRLRTKENQVTNDIFRLQALMLWSNRVWAGVHLLGMVSVWAGGPFDIPLCLLLLLLMAFVTKTNERRNSLAKESPRRSCLTDSEWSWNASLYIQHLGLCYEQSFPNRGQDSSLLKLDIIIVICSRTFSPLAYVVKAEFDSDMPDFSTIVFTVLVRLEGELSEIE